MLIDTRLNPLQQHWLLTVGTTEYRTTHYLFASEVIKSGNQKTISTQSCRMLADTVFSLAVLFTYWDLYIVKLIKLF